MQRAMMGHNHTVRNNNSRERCSSVKNIPIKDNVKYLGIHISKKISLRQEMNFLPKIKKAKLIFNNWLQRDLSFLGRVLLIKAEGLSHFIYPSFHYLFMAINVNKLIIYCLSFFCSCQTSSLW